jgi:hypothetical protein
MIFLLKNFWNALRRYKVASALNIAGLSVAFAAFAPILMQVRYDLTYDGSQPEAERILGPSVRTGMAYTARECPSRLRASWPRNSPRWRPWDYLLRGA